MGGGEGTLKVQCATQFGQLLNTVDNLRNKFYTFTQIKILFCPNKSQFRVHQHTCAPSSYFVNIIEANLIKCMHVFYIQDYKTILNQVYVF